MNPNFIDITATLSNMIPQGQAVQASDAAKVLASGDQGFESRFQKEVSRLDASFRTNAGAAAKASGKTIGEKVESLSGTESVTALKKALTDRTGEAGDEEGKLFLSALEQALMTLSKGDLSSVTMDAQGLDDLKALLVKAGFDPDAVEEVISGLKEKARDDALSLEDVMADLSELTGEFDPKTDSETDEVLLEASALPFLTAVLTELGIPEDIRTELINKADQGQKGISLDVILTELKQVKAQSADAGTTLTVEDGDDGFQALMSQLNMPIEKEGGAAVTLDDVLAAFESYKLKHQTTGTSAAANLQASVETPAAAAQADTLSLINNLFESFSLKAKIDEPGFSLDQVKHQFVDDLLIPGRSKTGKKSLFSQNTVSSGMEPESLLKEAGILMNKSMNKGSGDAGQDPSRSFSKELKSELQKGLELFQSTSGTRNESETQAAALRARPAQRSLPAYVTHQVGRGIVRAMNQGETSLKLQLKPAELGRLTMTIDNLGSSIKVHIVAENQAARDMLASNVGELKSALGSAGISLESFDVDMNSDFKQSMANAGNQFGQSGRKNKGRGNDGVTTSAGESTDGLPTDSTGLAETDGSYHFVA